MPLDDESRRELLRSRRILGRSLAFMHSPLGAIFGWYSEKPEPRAKRRVFLTADGRVIRTELQAWAQPELQPRPAGVPDRSRIGRGGHASPDHRGRDWAVALLLLAAAILVLITVRALLGGDQLSAEECERLAEIGKGPSADLREDLCQSGRDREP